MPNGLIEPFFIYTFLGLFIRVSQLQAPLVLTGLFYLRHTSYICNGARYCAFNGLEVSVREKPCIFIRGFCFIFAVRDFAHIIGKWYEH